MGNLIALRIVLALAGAFITFTGLNIALGGIQTLGWQGVGAFFTITDESTFLIQDSHVRYLGGVWAGVGFLFLAGATNPVKFVAALKFACVLIFLGGVARFSQMHFDVIFGPAIVGSLISEIFGAPVLYFWLSRSAGRTTHR